MHRRLPFVVAMAGALAAGCSSGDATPTTPLAAVTFATASSTAAPVSVPPTTRPTTSASSTPAASPSTTGSSASTSTTTTSTTGTSGAPTSTSSTTAPTTVAPPTTVAAAAFVPVAGPDVPDVTHPIDAAWVDPATQELLSVEDGAYWATVAGQGTADGGVEFVTFRLAQAFFGSACTARFGDDSCDNDIGTVESPTGTMPMFLGAGRITVADPTTQQSYAISGDVLFELIADPTAAVGAPEGYIYAPFASLIQVAGGQIVSAEQVWTP